MFKDYLGDSVYAEFDGFAYVLTTENGMGPSNTIILEPEVLAALNRYSARIAQELTLMRDQQRELARPQPERLFAKPTLAEKKEGG